MGFPTLNLTINGRPAKALGRCFDGLVTHSPIHLIQDRDPERFLLRVLAGIRCQATLVLANPDWQAQEQQQLRSFLAALPPHPSPTIYIPTGGSTGALKWIPHTLETLFAAARGFVAWYRPLHTVVVLPPYHVSGLMPLFRTWLTQGSLTVLSWQAFLTQPPNLTAASLSLVPTQLQRLLRHPAWVERLRAAEQILIGGAPLWPALRQQCLDLGIPIALSYGMTETAAAVAVIPPDQMHQEGYTPLPHGRLEVDGEGRIVIYSAAIPGGVHRSDDRGAWDPQGRLLWQGRIGQWVNTGGEKVLPAEVEALIWQSRLVEDIWVGGIPDLEWGERLIAIYVGDPGVEGRLRGYVRQHLAAYKCPKDWYRVVAIPRQGAGKVNRRELLRQAGIATLR
ncbi:MAG: AMP-binding protein [Thermostichales cyanobacterium BF4_bins_65]